MSFEGTKVISNEIKNKYLSVEFSTKYEKCTLHLHGPFKHLKSLYNSSINKPFTEHIVWNKTLYNAMYHFLLPPIMKVSKWFLLESGTDCLVGKEKKLDKTCDMVTFYGWISPHKALVLTSVYFVRLYRV